LRSYKLFAFSVIYSNIGAASPSAFRLPPLRLFAFKRLKAPQSAHTPAEHIGVKSMLGSCSFLQNNCIAECRRKGGEECPIRLPVDSLTVASQQDRMGQSKGGTMNTQRQQERKERKEWRSRVAAYRKACREERRQRVAR